MSTRLIIESILHLVVIGLLGWLLVNNHKSLKEHKNRMKLTIKKASTSDLVHLLPAIKDKELRKMILSELISRGIP